MAMLLGPANSSTMVRHVLDVREGALPSNHTISTLSLFPHFKYKHSKNKMLRVLQMVSGSQMTAPFFSVVICNLIEEPAEKHSDKPTKTIQHCNQWPDDCTFSGRNLIEEPTKTIQADGTPKHSNQWPDECTFFSGRNLINEGTCRKT